MALVQCAVCGKSVNTKLNNYIFVNGIHQHKKCPKGTRQRTPEDLQDFNDLKRAIQWAAVKYEKPLNWKLIACQISELEEMGYSCADQLYALKFVVSKDGTFFGYGRIKKFIDHAMKVKSREEEYLKAKEEKKTDDTEPIKITNKPKNFLNF